MSELAVPETEMPSRGRSLVVIRDDFPEAGLQTLRGGRNRTVEDAIAAEHGTRGVDWDFVPHGNETESVSSIPVDEFRIFSEVAREIAHVRGQRLDIMPQPEAMSRLGSIVAFQSVNKK